MGVFTLFPEESSLCSSYKAALSLGSLSLGQSSNNYIIGLQSVPCLTSLHGHIFSSHQRNPLPSDIDGLLDLVEIGYYMGTSSAQDNHNEMPKTGETHDHFSACCRRTKFRCTECVRGRGCRVCARQHNRQWSLVCLPKSSTRSGWCFYCTSL